MVSRYTTLVPPLRSCIGGARAAGISTGTRRGHVPPRKERRKKGDDFLAVSAKARLCDHAVYDFADLYLL